MRISDWSSDVCSSDLGAIAPLLARGPTTVENAVAAGYPSYPDVDVTSIPSNPDDLISIHVLRIEACSRKLQTLVGAPSGEIIFSETVSRLAGEFIPPLRSIEAQLPIDTITAAGTASRDAYIKQPSRQEHFIPTDQ